MRVTTHQGLQLYVSFGQNFECGDTPKLPQMSLGHNFALANALSGPPNDFLQFGGTQNQNSQYASVCEGHDVPRPPEVSFGQNCECDDTPKLPKMCLENNFALANALSGPLMDFSQRGCPQNRNSQAHEHL